MKSWVLMAGVSLAAVCQASDHNNIDAGAPLHFEDAYSIARGERVVEGSLRWMAHPSRFGAAIGFKQGFALNQEWGVEAELPPGAGGPDARFAVTYFRGLQREINSNPALAYRLTIAGTHESPAASIRLIATHTAGQFDKVHLNAEAAVSAKSVPEYAVALGWSRPLGLPRRFDQTLVAELLLTRSDEEDWRTSVGIGLRQQWDPQTMFSIGVEAEVNGGAQLTLGFSRSF